MLAERERTAPANPGASVTLDPDRTLAVLAEARQMQVRVLRQLAVALFTAPSKAITALPGFLRHTSVTGRANYS